MIDKIENGTLFIVPGTLKNRVIKEVREKFGLVDVKFMDIFQFRDQFYFTYDRKTVYYLMKKYHWKYEVCLVYLKNLYYINDCEYSYEKLIFLRDLKRELDEKGLLIYDPLFRDRLKSKKVLVYGFSSISLFFRKMFDEVGLITCVDILEMEKKNYSPDSIYEFETLEQEVNFVAIKISDLIRNGVDINKIKIANVSSDYYNTLIRIFGFYHIPIYFPRKISLYSTSIGKYFFLCLNNDIQVTLDQISTRFPDCRDEYNLIVDVLNQYCWCENYLDIRDMLVYEFKNTYLKEKRFFKEVECIELKNNIIEDDLHVFLMNFNQGSIPIIYKDEDYITDVMKGSLNTLESTVQLNLNERKEMLEVIHRIKNLVLSYKKESAVGSFIISNLNDELGLEVCRNFMDSYQYSNLYNELRLARDIDEFVKYGTVTSELSVLYRHYPDVSYLSYDNRLTGIDKGKLEKYLNHQLLLSYSTIDHFYRCSFRYYIHHILKLSIYEDTFMTTLGSLFHLILSKAFVVDDFNLDREYDHFIASCGKEFSFKEKFFLDKLKGELHFIVDAIQKQIEFCSLKEACYEKEIYVDKSNGMKITFMGIVDKIVYDTFDDQCIVSIIDYKTGNPNIQINHTIYGIEMQLPVYLYLVKSTSEFSNVTIAGFYLQKVLNNEILRDNEHTYSELKMNNLKLQGYSNEDVSVLEKFDSSFADSHVIKGLRTTKNGFASYSKVLNHGQIERLVSIVDSKIDEAIDSILNAKFDINPKRIGKVNYG